MCDSIINDLIATNTWQKVRSRKVYVCGKETTCPVTYTTGKKMPFVTTVFTHAGAHYTRNLVYICAHCATKVVNSMRLYHEISLRGVTHGLRLVDPAKMENIDLGCKDLDLPKVADQYVLLRTVVHTHGANKDIADQIASAFVALTEATVSIITSSYSPLKAMKIYWVEPLLHT